MSYLVTCSFDLKNASWQDYQNAYADLQKIGLKRVIVSDQGREVVTPSTMVIGEFNGQSAAGVRDFVSEAMKNAFTARRFSAGIFVVVGGDSARGATST